MKFYVTYPQRLSELKNKFSVVEAKDQEEARQIVSSIRGSVWAFIYNETQFEGQPEKYGLSEVNLT